jgi:hypothetical protein
VAGPLQLAKVKNMDIAISFRSVGKAVALGIGITALAVASIPAALVAVGVFYVSK